MPSLPLFRWVLVFGMAIAIGISICKAASNTTWQHLAPGGMKSIVGLGEVTYDNTPTMRGGSWCEINAQVPKVGAITVIPCQTGPLIPGPQNGDNTILTDCCPYSNWKALYSPKGPFGHGTALSSWLRKYHPADTKTGMYPLVMSMHRKSLWDTQEGCTQATANEEHGEEPSQDARVPQWLVCENDGDEALQTTRDEKCMWFHNAGLNYGGAMDPWNTRFTEEYPRRQYKKGKRQAIINDNNGTIWLLHSYVTTLKDGSNAIKGGSFEPGEEDNFCSYIDICCSTLPSAWSVSCGLLQETATCGATCQGNSVTVDDIMGTWCKTDAGAVVVPESAAVEPAPGKWKGKRSK